MVFDLGRLATSERDAPLHAHHGEYLWHLARHWTDRLELLILNSGELFSEFAFLAEHPEIEFHPSAESIGPFDLLYSANGPSKLADPSIPQISYLPDTLHLEHPDSISHEEIAERERLSRETVAQSSLIHTSSKHASQILATHYGIQPETLFHTYFICHSRFPSEDIQLQFDASPTSSFFVPTSTFRKGRPYFLTPANGERRDNHKALLVAYRQYRANAGPDALALVFANLDPELAKPIRQARNALKLQDHVLLLDPLSPAEQKALWQSSSAILLPSVQHNSLLPFFDAMHFEKPIIASQLAPIDEILADQYIPCDPRQPQDIARAMAEPGKTPPTAKLLASFDLADEANELAKRILKLAKPAG